VSVLAQVHSTFSRENTVSEPFGESADQPPKNARAYGLGLRLNSLLRY